MHQMQTEGAADTAGAGNATKYSALGDEEDGGVLLQPHTQHRKPKRKVLLGIGLAILLIVLIIIIVVATKNGAVEAGQPDQPDKLKAGNFSSAGVASDATICSAIGSSILRKNGSAADAAVATTFCAGVANPFSCGIGGGGFLVYFKKSSKEFFVYDYREVAPALANETMYIGRSSQVGALASGVPGEVKGMWKVHQQHGKLKWEDLLEPSIKLAEEGLPVIKPFANAIQSIRNKVKRLNLEMPADLKKLITNEDGEYLTEGDLFVNQQLGNTLRMIQKDGQSAFYEGDVARNMTRDVQAGGGILTMEDMKNYTVRTPKVFDLKLPNGYTINTMPLPGGGPIVAMIHNIISGYDFTKLDMTKDSDVFEFWQKFIESMKFSYAQRGLLGDPDYVPKDNITRVLDLIKDLKIGADIRKNKILLNQTHHQSYYGGFWGKDDFGTSHSSIIAENGDAVSTTNTVNTYFGSLFVSPSTGIIMNNEMDDFSTPGRINAFGYPPSPANFIRPGKRPLSSMSPTIVTDKDGNVKIAVGASGGSKIISGTATVMAKYMYLNMALGDAITSYRLHNQGVPNKIAYNQRIPTPDALLKRLREIGHKVEGSNGDCVTQAVAREQGRVYAMSDPRKEATASGY